MLFAHANPPPPPPEPVVEFGYPPPPPPPPPTTTAQTLVTFAGTVNENVPDDEVYAVCPAANTVYPLTSLPLIVNEPSPTALGVYVIVAWLRVTVPFVVLRVYVVTESKLVIVNVFAAF